MILFTTLQAFLKINVSGVHGFVSLTLRLPLFVAKKFNVIFVTVKNGKSQNLIAAVLCSPQNNLHCL